MNGKVIFVVLYVDDVLLIEKDVEALSSVKMWLTQQFSIKDLGEANYVLGIRILRDGKNKVIVLSQTLYMHTYIHKILECFVMVDSKKGT